MDKQCDRYPLCSHRQVVVRLDVSPIHAYDVMVIVKKYQFTHTVMRPRCQMIPYPDIELSEKGENPGKAIKAATSTNVASIKREQDSR